MPYEYSMPEALEHILQTMKSVLDLFDGVDSAAPEHHLIADTYRKLDEVLLTHIKQMTGDDIKISHTHQPAGETVATKC